MKALELEKIEIDLLIEAIRMRYGYDFRNYSKASIRRRIRKRMKNANAASVSELQHLILYDQKAFDALLFDLTINVTEMFRDPSFFKALREQILPQLASRETIRVWHAGCATGEEVYSMAILLKEAGLYDKTRIYATDMDETVLRRAREGIYSADQIRTYTYNYQKSGGTESFADYYSARYESVIMNKDLKRNMVFADHNLVTDRSIGEMDLVICRNVLIYFNRVLQDRVIGLFAESLRPEGFLGLGSKESLRFCKHADYFSETVDSQKIFARNSEPLAISVNAV